MGANWRRLVQTIGGPTLIGCGLIVVGIGLVGETGDSNAARGDVRASHETAAPPRSVPEAATDRLPDLDQELPTELDVRSKTDSGARTFRLGFRSAVRNVGDGPLIVDGARPDTGTPTMTVNQVVQRVAMPERVVPDVGRMEYSVSPDHSHWHYLQFDRYELQRYMLRRAGSDEVLVTDRKTGFCLGDRYYVRDRRLAAAPPAPVFTGGCGLRRPDLLHMHEGISVGYGDDYSAFLEGQDLSLEGVGDGRYVLVHRVNGNHRLQELSYANNAASVLFDLSWPGGLPQIRVLARCPDTDRCGTAGSKA